MKNILGFFWEIQKAFWSGVAMIFILALVGNLLLAAISFPIALALFFSKWWLLLYIIIVPTLAFVMESMEEKDNG